MEESKQVSPLDQWEMVRIMWDCRLSTGLPPSSWLHGCEEGRPAASVKPGQESCVRSSGTDILSVRGPSDSYWGRSPVDDQSRRGHQCSVTTLTGESRFHISPPGDLNLWPLWREANRLVYWTSETWWESCEIAGSPQYTTKNQFKLARSRGVPTATT